MESVLNRIAREDHSEYDAFVCCILTHGELFKVKGTDNKCIRIYDLALKFRGNACRSLIDKPKMFFIQACQGTEPMGGAKTEAEDPLNVSVEEDGPVLAYILTNGFL